MEWVFSLVPCTQPIFVSERPRQVLDLAGLFYFLGACPAVLNCSSAFFTLT